jgi:hypothetical protein
VVEKIRDGIIALESHAARRIDGGHDFWLGRSGHACDAAPEAHERDADDPTNPGVFLTEHANTPAP